MTPLNFSLWGSLYLGIGNSPESIRLNPADMFINILLILGVPVLAGMFFAAYFPDKTKKIKSPLKKASMVIFILFVIVAFSNNFEIFIGYIQLVIGLVLLHNLLAILTGYYISKAFGLSKIDK